jgi:hypothetical protein
MIMTIVKEDTNKPDLGHLAWVLDQRVEIQRTLLDLYRFVRANTTEALRSSPFDNKYDFVKPMLLDHLIAAGFSLWRAVFLSESHRDFDSIHKSQEKFLERVLTNNAITYTDDKANRAWTVSYYLENAKHRLSAAVNLAEHYLKDKCREKVQPLLRLKGEGDVASTRYELECIHAAMRMIFKILDPQSMLPALQLKLPDGEG